MQYQIPSAPKRFEGPPQRLESYALSQPAALREVRQQPPGSPVRTEGAVVASAGAFVFSQVSQPTRQRGYLVRTSTAVRSARTAELSDRLPPWGEGLQPEVRAFAPFVMGHRFMVDAQPRVEGAVVSAVMPLAAVMMPDLRWAGMRPTPMPSVPLTGAAAAAQEGQTFRLVETPLAQYYTRPAPRLIVRYVRGTATAQTVLPTVSDAPDERWWKTIAQRGIRLDLGAPTQGPTVAPLFVFPAAILGRLEASRQQPVMAQRFDGVTTQETFVFPLLQPDLRRGRDHLVDVGLTKHLTGVFTPPPVAQWYLYPISQPQGPRWVFRRVPSEHVDAPIRLEGAAPIAPQTYLYPPDQPERRAYLLREAWRYGLTLPPFLGHAIPITNPDVIEFIVTLMRTLSSDGTIVRIPDSDVYIVRVVDSDVER